MDEKLHVAVFTEICNSHSGARAPVELALAFARSPHIASILFVAYAYKKDMNIVKKLKHAGVETYLIPIKKISFTKKLLAGIKLTRLLKTKRLDVISFHGTLPLFVAAIFLQRPIITTYYGTQFHAYAERFNPDKQLNFIRTVLNFAGNLLTYIVAALPILFSQKVIATSSFAGQECLRLYRRNAQVIYLGADGVLFPGKLNIKPKSGPPLRLLSVSRITPYKGFHLLIKLVDRLNAQGFPCHLTIAGSLTQTFYLKHLRSLKSKYTHILTDINDSILDESYRTCDVYVSADRYLFFGLPPLEAALRHKPSVLFNYGAANEIVVDAQTGFVVNDDEEFINRIKYIITHKKRLNKMGLSAYRNTLRHFSWNTAVQKYLDLFKDCRPDCSPILKNTT